MENFVERDSKLPWRAIEDCAVVVQPRGNEVHELNATGAFLWERADGSRTTEQLAAALAEEFDVDPVQARADVAEFVAKLAEKGLVQCRS